MISRRPSVLRSSLYLVLLVFSCSYHLSVAWASSLSPDSSTSMRDLAKTGVHNDAAAYNEFASASVDLSDAHVSKDGLFTVIRSVRDIDNNKRRRFLYSIPLPDPKHPDRSFPSIPPTELQENIKVRLPSPTGNKIAIFRQESPTESSSRQVLEVWTNGGQALLRRIVLPETSHGKVINDAGGFGCPAWNADETVLVYTAERNNPETVSFFANSGSADNDAKLRGGTNTLGVGKYESWGEKYSKQSALFDLFCVNVETGNVGRVENVPGQEDAKASNIGGYTLGQPVFSPKGESVVYTGWDAGGGSAMPRRLGLIYCQQRPSQLYSSSIAKLLERLASTTKSGDGAHDEEIEKDKAFVDLTPENRISRSPAFSPVAEDGACKLVFLASKKGFDTHQGCLALHLFDWSDEKATADNERVIVDQVWDPRESPLEIGEFDGLRFPGLFLQQLIATCFSSAEYLVATTQWGSRQKVVQVSLKDGSTSAVDFGGPSFSEELLCVAPDGGLVVSKKSPNVPNAVYYIPKSSTTGTLQDGILLPGISPIASTAFSAVPLTASWDFKCSIEILADPPQVDGVDLDLPVQSILLLPDKAKHPKPPVIVVPHGGPHSCSSAIYLPSYAYLCSHGGYALLLVNYRGSTGFGQASIEALPSKIGDLDVKDVVAATLKLKESGAVDPDRIGICGGSHGGFLTGHCTSQYPDLFKAAAMRNPVVNIPAMVTVTDIPDWCYVEACGKYSWGEYRPPSQEELRVMWEKSPIRYIENVKTPTLVALGLSDLRVPPSQGKEWYHTLRAKGIPTKLLVYEDDDHAIAGVVSEADHWVNIKRFFDEHM